MEPKRRRLTSILLLILAVIIVLYFYLGQERGHVGLPPLFVEASRKAHVVYNKSEAIGQFSLYDQGQPMNRPTALEIKNILAEETFRLMRKAKKGDAPGMMRVGPLLCCSDKDKKSCQKLKLKPNAVVVALPNTEDNTKLPNAFESYVLRLKSEPTGERFFIMDSSVIMPKGFEIVGAVSKNESKSGKTEFVSFHKKSYFETISNEEINKPIAMLQGKCE
jgi:hypothetical protein